MFPKYYSNRDFIFLLTLVILSTFFLTHTKTVDKHGSKKALESERNSSKASRHKTDIPTSQRKSETRQEKSEMKINNNLQVRGNITSSKITTKNINITGQAIVAKTSTAQEIAADKIGVQQIYVNEIRSPNVCYTLFSRE